MPHVNPPKGFVEAGRKTRGVQLAGVESVKETTSTTVGADSDQQAETRRLRRERRTLENYRRVVEKPHLLFWASFRCDAPSDVL